MNDIIPGTRVEGKVLIDGAGHLRAGGRRRRSAPARRHGVPEVEPVPEVDLRERRLRAADQPHGAVARRARGPGRGEPARRRRSGTKCKDRLHDSALALSGGQQQRLCIARALAIEPEILLMDEPASALDPIATQRIEELIYQLKTRYTIVIVTHNMQQAARVSDVTAFFWLGKLVECDRTEQDLHRSGRKADRGLRHREVRLMDARRTRRPPLSGGARALKSAAARDGRARRGARAPRPSRASSTRSRPARPRARRRRAGQRAAHRDRQPLLHAAGAVSADGHRPARDRRRRQDQHRPRARRRPGGQHRRGGARATSRTRR